MTEIRPRQLPDCPRCKETMHIGASGLVCVSCDGGLAPCLHCDGTGFVDGEDEELLDACEACSGSGARGCSTCRRTGKL